MVISHNSSIGSYCFETDETQAVGGQSQHDTKSTMPRSNFQDKTSRANRDGHSMEYASLRRKSVEN